MNVTKSVNFEEGQEVFFTKETQKKHRLLEDVDGEKHIIAKITSIPICSGVVAYGQFISKQDIAKHHQYIELENGFKYCGASFVLA